MHLVTFRNEYPGLTNAIVLTAAGLVGFRLAWLATTFTVNQYQATAAGVRMMLASQNAQLVISRTQMMLTGAQTRAAAAAQWLFNAAAAANPVMLLVGAIAVLGVGLYVLYQNFEFVRNGIDWAWQRFAETFPNAAAVLQTIGDKVSWLTGKFKSLIGLQSDSAQMEAGSGMGAFRAIEAVPHATGGIFTKPHVGLVAEAGYAEAVIPIDGSARSLSLLQQTGELLGVNSSQDNNTSIWQKANDLFGGSSGGSTFQITFAPVIQGSNPDEIMPELQRQQDSFMDQFKEVVWQQGRVKLA